MQRIRSMFTAAFAVAALALVAAPASAQTDVNANWNGAGLFSFDANVSNGADMSFGSLGSSGNFGSINFHNAGDNPFGYGVSTVSNHVVAGVSGGAGSVLLTSFDRDSSYAPMYGAGGQSTFTAVSLTGGGSAEIAVHNNANYASLRQVNWNQDRTTNGKTLEASGVYSFTHGISSNVSEGAAASGSGSGSVDLTTNASTANNGGWNFGKGAGIFTLAKYNASGSGGVSFNGQADNVVNTTFGSFSGPGASANFGGTFGSGASVPDFSMSGN